MRLLQNLQHGLVARPSCGAFALDDVGQRRDMDRHAFDGHGRRPRALLVAQGHPGASPSLRKAADQREQERTECSHLAKGDIRLTVGKAS